MSRSRRALARLVGLALLTAIAAAVTTVPGRASNPSSGSISAESPSVSWTGGPFAAINPTVDTDCVVPEAPYCDVFDLSVGALAPTAPDVAVSIEMDSSSDFINVAIFNEAGENVADAGSLGSKQLLVVEDVAPGTYSVRVELMLGTPTVSTYRGSATATDGGAPVDMEQGCLAEETTVVLEPDDGRIVDLDVLVLLDGVDQSFAAEFFQQVAEPYAELAINVVPTFEIADPPFIGTETTDILNQARSRYPGGKIPAEYDIVEVLTSKDLTLAGLNGVAGQADCLGGIAFDQRSYNVSEAAAAGYPEEGIPFGPFNFAPKFAAKVTAHEIGHLLGGQHHYANCVEGNHPDEELNDDTSPCTLMANFADVISLDFGTLNGAIVRGYALKYAAANDN